MSQFGALQAQSAQSSEEEQSKSAEPQPVTDYSPASEPARHDAGPRLLRIENSFSRGPASSNVMPGSAPISMRSGMRTSSLIV
jgi:hypothetical protein